MNIGEKGNVRLWQYMNGREFARIDKPNTIVMVTCSPMEVHGPHLPVFTDNAEAEGITARSIEKFSLIHPEAQFLRLPPIYVSCDVLPQLGSLQFRPGTIISVLADLGRTLAAQGFKDIWVASFHGGPRHFVAIEHACEKTNRRYRARMISLFSLLTRLLTEGSPDLSGVLGPIDGLNPADLEGDIHAGVIETSMMLKLFGEYVDPMYKTLPRQTLELKLAARGKKTGAFKAEHSSIWELLRGFSEGLKYFSEETYAGAPAGSSAEIGDKIIDMLSDHCVSTLSKLWNGEIKLSDCHSPAWKYRWLFLIPAISTIFERAVGYKNPVF